MENYDIMTINEAVRRSKTELKKDGTLPATYAGRKALVYWPNLVRLLCGEAIQSNKQNQREVTPCS